MKVEIVANQSLVGPVLCLHDNAPTHDQILFSGNNAFFATCETDMVNISSAEYHDLLVISPREMVGREIFENMNMKTIRSIHWYFESDLTSALNELEQLNMTQFKKLIRVNVRNNGVVLSTGLTGGITAGSPDFRLGLQAGILAEAQSRLVAVNKFDNDYVNQLHLKLVAALEFISQVSADLTNKDTANSGRIDGSTLESELVRLKRNHDALERKYASLSSSKLGKITLKAWELKRGRQGS